MPQATPIARQTNEAPIANAGGNRNAYTGLLVTLNGSGYDPDGEPIIAYYWTMYQAACDECWAFSSPGQPQTGFFATQAGDYVVSLVVEDPGGLSAPSYATIHVADNLPPVAIATANPTSVTLGSTICFDGSTSYDPEGQALTYIWNFSDGSPLEYAATACHAYTSPGVFDGVLQVTDQLGANGTAIVAVTILPPNNHPPVAAPTDTPNEGVAPLTVQFTANASDADNDPLSYAWAFGDGATSTLANPNHVYIQPGTYTATLVVSDGKATSPTYSKTVVVGSPLSVSVRTATLVFMNKQQTMGFATLWTDLSAPVPAAGDTLSASMDGAQLFSLPFSAFKKGVAPGAYVHAEKGLLVRLDFTGHQILVITPNMSLSGIDNGNGVDVKLTVGAASAVQNIVMKPAPFNTLYYVRAGPVGSPPPH